MPKDVKRLYLTESEVNEMLDMKLALDALDEVFRARSAGEVRNEPRHRLAAGNGSMNFMAAAWPEKGWAGHKSYVNGDFRVMLYGTRGEGLLAVIGAGRMGQVRTGAASGIATRYMARENSSSVGIIGSGYQAETQLEAVCAVRDIKDVKVFSRTAEKRDRFASVMSDRLGVNIVAVDSKEAAADGMDILVAVTSSVDPVITGDMIEPGIHINAAGNNSWMKRELDTAAIVKADLVACDDIDQSKIECGELMRAVEVGQFAWESLVRLDRIVAGLRTARNSDTDVTLFESQGVAFEDLAVCGRLYELALERGVGTELG
ncbi:MAG TPA: ornithine cyclodeaminase family protein [Dehalococcoidia bacterium]|nr:ornithine cyclodeaminase family protein [Dehalococcoidia bacterium]HIK88181.1 ornithine cyclodeaminase family protein [Dehalococcoidia bacterium]